ACKTLRDAPSDEAARLALIATLPDFAELQRRLNAALAGNLPRTLRRSPQRMARRSGPDPLSWPAAAGPRRDLPLRGQKRDQQLPRLRHALRHPQRLPLHRGIDPGLPADLWPQLFSDVNCIALWISSEKILTRLYSVLHWFHKRLEANVKNPREN